jgi:3-hydroxyisobutyrate dehydrogenase
MIAFLGTGLLGTGFVRAARRRGEDVAAWNRTFARAEPLADCGARVYRDAAEAVRGASRVHVSVADDAAVDDVLARAAPGFGDSVRAIVDHSTTSVHGIAARRARWAERGIVFVHAPVFMGPQNAHDATGVMLASGDAAALDALRAPLAAMTGKLVELGPRPEAAAAFKLLGNLFLMFLTTGLADFLMLAKATGVAPADAAKLFEAFNPGATVAARLRRMMDGNFEEPSWELVMARKDARLILDEAARAELALAIVPAIAARMDAVIAAGFGSHDWTVLGRDALA